MSTQEYSPLLYNVWSTWYVMYYHQIGQWDSYEQDRINNDYGREYSRDRVDARDRVDNRRYNRETVNNAYGRDRMNREPQRRNEDYRYQERSNIDQNRNYNREREYRISERERLEREKEKSVLRERGLTT